MVVITTFSPPTEGIIHEQPSTQAFLRDVDMGKGTLYISESRLAWGDSCSGKGFSLDYRNISMHAVCRDLENYTEECLLVYLDTSVSLSEDGGIVELLKEHQEEDEDEMGSTEFRFIPEDKVCLNSMYQAMTHCQALYPDPDDSVSSGSEGEKAPEGGDSEYYTDEGEDFQEGPNRNGLRDLGMEVDGQFDDAEGEREN